MSCRTNSSNNANARGKASGKSNVQVSPLVTLSKQTQTPAVPSFLTNFVTNFLPAPVISTSSPIFSIDASLYVSASNSSQILQSITFANSNDISFGLSNGVITASFSNTGGVGGVAISAGTESASSGTVIFSNVNGVTFGMDGSTITASVAGATAGSLSAGTASMALGQVVFSNASGVSFGLNGSTVTASVRTNYQSSGNYLTTAMVSDAGSRFVNTSAGLNLTNISATLASNSISLSVAAPVTTNGLISAVKLSAGTLSTNRTDVTLADSNGISFGMETNGVITATVKTDYQTSGNYLTTAMQSNAGSDFVQATAVFAGTNASGTIASDGISVSVAAQSVVPQNASLYGLGNTTQNSSTVLSLNALSINAIGSLTVGYSNGSIQLSAPNALTTAALSNHSHGNPTLALTNLTGTTASASNGFTLSLSAAPPGAVSINVSAGTTSNNLTNFEFADTNGVSFGLNGSTITATVATNYQSQGAYLTTAAQSTQTFLASLGGNTGTTNSSRIGNGGFVFAGGNGVTINQSNNSVSWSVETAYQSQGAYLTTAAQSTQTIMISLGGNTGTTNSSRISNGDYVFAGGNGVTINQSNNSISWSVETNYQSTGAYITTAALSNHSHGNPTLALTNLTGTTASASNGFTLSLSGPAAGLTTAALSSQTLAFTLSGNSATTNSSQILNGGYALAGGNGVTLQQSNNTVSFSVATNYQSQGAYLTTAALSGDTTKYIQNWKLTGNTAGTTSSAQGTDLWLAGGNGVTISGSSNTLSFSVATNYQSQGAYLTTARASTDAIGLATAKTNVTWTANSAGLSLDAGGYAGTGFTSAGANISLSGTLNTAGLSLSASVAAPGAVAENNYHNLLGANTAGNTTASGSTIGLSGVNLTLSGTNASQIVISAPGTSSISGTGQVSISVNGSTISIGVPDLITLTYYNPLEGCEMLAGQIGQGTLHMHPVSFSNVQFDRVIVPLIHSVTATSVTASYTLSYWQGLYTKNASTLSLLSSWSSSVGITYGTSNSSLYGAYKLFSIGKTDTITKGQYYMANLYRTTSGGANGLTFSQFLLSRVNSNLSGLFGVANNASVQATLGLGSYSATTNAIPSSIPFSDLRGTASAAYRPPAYYFISGTA